MKFTVKSLATAEADISDIFRWIVARSVKGAWSLQNALESRVKCLADDAAGCAVAKEAHRLGRDIRETYFKTRYGRRYRIVFTIVDTEVHILRVRAFGQRLLRSNDLPRET